MNVQFQGNKVTMDKSDFINLIGGAKINSVDVMGDGESTLEQDITNYLDKKGFKRNIKGFRFLRSAIGLVMENPDLLSAITKKLYPSIATEFASSGTRVERAIRHTIVLTYGEDKPTNSEFIALAADVIRLKRESVS